MLILYVAMKFDYGKPERGLSFEHYNFYDSLVHMGHDILYFDFMTMLQKQGQERMNQRLVEVIRVEKPTLMFTVLFEDELDPNAIRKVSMDCDTVTLNWFCDDHWRFDNFSHRWAPCFNWVVTTAQSALPKYAKIGYPNVIKSQWGCNHFLYRKLNLPLLHDVTFVGQPHGNRREVIEAIRRAGLNVRVWGQGWDNGRLIQEQMIEVFNQSRINLNLSNASVQAAGLGSRVKSTSRALLSRSLSKLPFGTKLKTWAKPRLQAARRHLESWRRPGPFGAVPVYLEQIKGRNFEIPGCGGFLLTERAENLEDYYEDGKEIVCFAGTNDLIEKARYFLRHEDERAAIAQAGYERTAREHTYAHRFTEILQRVELPTPALEAVLAGTVCPGQTEEVH